MSVRVIPAHEVAGERAVARAAWLQAIERAQDRLSDAELEHCLNPRNLDAWWPNPHAGTKTEAA